MTNIDDQIRAALSAEDKAFLDDIELADANPMDEIFRKFVTRWKWISWIAYFYSFLAFIGAIWSAWKFFKVDEPGAQILFATCFLTCMLMTAMLKMWTWMQMNKNTLMIEIKRLQLMVARD